MSEFECRFNHMMRPGQTVCPECLKEGRVEGIHYMDGLSGSQWRKQEKWEEEQERRRYDEEDEDSEI